MKKIFITLLFIMMVGCYEQQEADVYYQITSDQNIETNIRYKIGDDYFEETITPPWKSETFKINEDLFYYRIEILPGGITTGCCIVYVDDKVKQSCPISSFMFQILGKYIMAGYIDLDGDETTSVTVGL